jgi:hypothetical protein
MPTPAPPGHQPMADRPAPRIPLARLVWSRWVVNPLVLSLVALPLTLPGQVRRVVRLRCTTTGVRAFRDVHRSVISVPRRMRPPLRPIAAEPAICASLRSRYTCP